VSRASKPKGPRRVDGKIDYPDMFEWAVIKAVPETLERVVGDVSAAAERAVPTMFVAFLAIWLPMSEDYPLKNSLGFATLGTFLVTALVYAVRARRTKCARAE
jgi:hypothetical protein